MVISFFLSLLFIIIFLIIFILGNMTQVREVYQRMKRLEVRPTEQTYTTLIEVTRKNEGMEKALEALNLMEQVR